jgi:hypothetical protein
MFGIKRKTIAPVLWIDAADSLSRATTRIQDPALREHTVNMITNGYTVLRNLPTAHYCDQAVEDYYRFCREEHAEGRGKKSRIVNLHIYSEAARALLLDPKLMPLLDILFGYEAVLWTSLTFEYGTEQRRHRDSPHFDTRPPGYYFGVWTALEDISADSGPLEFIPGGHKIPAGIDVRAMAKEYLRSKDPLEAVNYDHLLEVFSQDMDDQCAAAGLNPRSVQLNKGEKLIWHHWMPHGGSPAVNPELTRRSLVGHYIPKGVPVFHADVFFGVVEPDKNVEHQYDFWGGRKYVSFSRADFQTKYV